jgi:hypothetical protein
VIAASPTPTAEEAAAIVAAVQAVLAGERSRSAYDPLPAVYRSKWRAAAIADAVGVSSNEQVVVSVF